MSDQPLTLAVLAQFHREVFLPDFERVIGAAFAEGTRRMRARLLDERLRWLDLLDRDYQFLKSGLAVVEERLDRLDESRDRLDQGSDRVAEAVERLNERLAVLVTQYEDVRDGLHRLDERLRTAERKIDELAADREKEPLRAKAADLRARVDGLQAQVRTLERRLEG